MNANELLFYLKGFFENTEDPSGAQIANVASEVLAATPVPDTKIVTYPMANPSVFDKKEDCGCQDG